jgi:hypothetical protein
MLGKRIKVALDSRCETVFPEKIREAAFGFEHGRDGWEDFLKDYPPDMIFVVRNTRLYHYLSQKPGWGLAWSDRATAPFEGGAEGKSLTPARIVAS